MKFIAKEIDTSASPKYSKTDANMVIKNRVFECSFSGDIPVIRNADSIYLKFRNGICGYTNQTMFIQYGLNNFSFLVTSLDKINKLVSAIERLNALDHGFKIEIEMQTIEQTSETKTTNPQKFTFGIEIECAHVSLEGARKAIDKTIGSIHYDGSVSSGAELSMNPIRSNKVGIKKVSDACMAFKGLNGNGRHSTCGGHIHIGINAFENTDHVNRCVEFVNINKHVFLPVSGRSEESGYARFNMTNGRYCAVNTEAVLKHGTIEFRFWSGTLNSELIISRIKLMKKIVAITKSADMFDLNRLAIELAETKEYATVKELTEATSD